MPIVVDIDVMLAKRKMPVGTLADRVGITPANLAVLKNGRAKAVRFTTLKPCARCWSASPATCCAGSRRTRLRARTTAGGRFPSSASRRAARDNGPMTDQDRELWDEFDRLKPAGRDRVEGYPGGEPVGFGFRTGVRSARVALGFAVYALVLGTVLVAAWESSTSSAKASG